MLTIAGVGAGAALVGPGVLDPDEFLPPLVLTLLIHPGPVIWPAEVIDDLPLVAESFEGDVAPFDEMSRAATVEQAAAVQFPDITEAIQASLLIRAALGLPEDTAKGC